LKHQNRIFPVNWNNNEFCRADKGLKLQMHGYRLSNIDWRLHAFGFDVRTFQMAQKAVKERGDIRKNIYAVDLGNIPGLFFMRQCFD
jgi:hypothetical protein